MNQKQQEHATTNPAHYSFKAKDKLSGKTFDATELIHKLISERAALMATVDAISEINTHLHKFAGACEKVYTECSKNPMAIQNSGLEYNKAFAELLLDINEVENEQ